MVQQQVKVLGFLVELNITIRRQLANKVSNKRLRSCHAKGPFEYFAFKHFGKGDPSQGNHEISFINNLQKSVKKLQSILENS